MNIEIIKSSDELPWHWLHSHNNFFLTKTYLQNWFTHLCDGELSAVSIRDSQEVRALFLIVKSRETVFGKQVRLWRYAGWSNAAYPLAFLPNTPETASAFFSFLAPKVTEWDGVLVSCTRDILSDVAAEAIRFGFGLTEQSRQIIPFVSILSSWEDYWRDLSENLRKNIRRLLNKVKRYGNLTYRTVTNEEECNDILQVFIQMHHQRWIQKGEQSKYATRQRHQNFLRSLVMSLLLEGKLFLRYLALDNTPIAIAIGVRDGRKLYYGMPSFSLQHGDLAPGKLLLYHIIKEAFDHRCCEVDLGLGAHEYKFSWANGQRELIWLIVSRGEPRIWFKYHLIPLFKRNIKTIAQYAPESSVLLRNMHTIGAHIVRKWGW